ncbi:hypothetical protein Tgr7_0430 [Thioalkalivibrio sulfidiphilus HL-EbGr7]|uniref:Uncharacterized protein n=1 Tax=Thioalkalivibrio sulfidiphilus (strain HL-EbGR7) TaxID=396588 RepID=B8GL10_THISH|nr:hypothetical protein [Thioalkalivibrio sulfidiphilus]ACL71528.1 hypothetical protein Tgr7_0430 [Thioalkalivibrio sulfidiphilus HL-EbGr7]
MSEQIMRALGRIEGELQGIKQVQSQQHETLARVDHRLGDMEVKTAKHGALYGSTAAVGVMLIIEGIKNFGRSQGS